MHTGLPGDRNRLQGVERGNRQDESPHTLPDGDRVAIPTVNPWVSSVPTCNNPYIITDILKPYFSLCMPKARGGVLRVAA